MESNEYGYEDLSVIINEGQGRHSVSRWQANGLYVLSAVLMFGLRGAVTLYGKPKFVKPNVSFWKWRNIFISWIHGIIIGIWVILCIWWYPGVLQDPIFYLNNCVYLLVPFSIGYFTCDLIDIVTANKIKEHGETVLHHVLIIIVMSITWNVKILVGGAVIILGTEVNSIFLHLRKLLQFSDVGFESVPYRVVSVLNLLTFVVFRFIPIFYVIVTLVVGYNRIPRALLLMVLTLFPPGILINIGLFYLVFRSDVLRPFFGFGETKEVKKE